MYFLFLSLPFMKKSYIAMGATTLLALSIALPVSAASTSSKKAVSKVDTACVAAAVGTREDKIVAAQDTYATAWKTARLALKDQLVSAWNAKDTKARKAAWDTYAKALKDANAARKAAVKAAWTEETTAVKTTCKGTSADAAAEVSGQTADLK